MVMKNCNDPEYVRFFYREETRDGRFVINEYAGHLSRIYKNGWFILSDSDGLGPARFEWLAVVK